MPVLALGLAGLIGGAVFAIRTAPKPDFGTPLENAGSLVAAAEYEHAIELLNTKILPHLESAAMAPLQRARFHQLIARSIALGQKAKGLDRRDNHETVVEQYVEAEHLGAKLDEIDVRAVAESQMALGELDAALARADALGDSASAGRRAIYRRAIDRMLAGPRPEQDAGLALISRMLADPGLPIEERVWATGRQTEVLLARGFADEAIAKLLRVLPRMQQAEGKDLGQLYLQLGRAYFETGALADSSRQLARAAELLDPNDTAQADVLLLEARLRERASDFAGAREFYQGLLARFETTPPALWALAGLGDAEALAGTIDDSFKAYEELVKAVNDPAEATRLRQAGLTTQEVGTRLLGRSRDAFAKGDSAAALRFATMGEAVFEGHAPPPELVLALAETHLRLANEVLGGTGSSQHADPATRAQAQPHLVNAGDYYKRYAGMIVLTDTPAYGEALWWAADCFDRAGDRDATVAALQEFVSSFPGDARLGEARYRLARSYQARGDLELAVQIFRQLIAGREEGGGSGAFGDASYVPLAQALLADDIAENDAEAETLLTSVVNGALGEPDGRSFRDALVELGRLQHATARYGPAAESFDAALTRFPNDEEIDGVRYLLADSLRRLADEIARRLNSDGMPDTVRAELTLGRQEHLARAMAVFEQVRRSLEAKDERRRSPLEQMYLRNAYFFVPSCAFDLGTPKDLESSIRLYEAARERYPNDPTSLAAMIQIVNANLKLGDLRRAATANERARRFFQSLPDSAWDDPALPISRGVWQAWLDATAELDRKLGAAPAGN